MSILDMFRGTSQASAAAPQGGQEGAQDGGQQSQQVPGQQPGGQQVTDPTGQAPAYPQQGQQAPSNGGQQQEELSPMEELKDIWDNFGKPDENAAPQDPSQLINVDPKKIQEAVSKVDFAQVVSPDVLAKISAGGEDATQAFAQALNSVAQTVFSQSMVANAEMLRQSFSGATEIYDNRMNNSIRRNAISSTTSQANPAFSHPAAKPMIEALEGQLARKFPQATPDQIANKAQEFFKDFAKSMGMVDAPQDTGRSKSGIEDMDWESWASE